MGVTSSGKEHNRIDVNRYIYYNVLKLHVKSLNSKKYWGVL